MYHIIRILVHCRSVRWQFRRRFLIMCAILSWVNSIDRFNWHQLPIADYFVQVLPWGLRMFPLATVVQVFCVYDKILVHGTVEMLLHCQLWTWNLSGLGLLIRILFDLAAPTFAMKLRQFSESPWAFDLDVNPCSSQITLRCSCFVDLNCLWAGGIPVT